MTGETEVIEVGQVTRARIPFGSTITPGLIAPAVYGEGSTVESILRLRVQWTCWGDPAAGSPVHLVALRVEQLTAAQPRSTVSMASGSDSRPMSAAAQSFSSASGTRIDHQRTSRQPSVTHAVSPRPPFEISARLPATGGTRVMIRPSISSFAACIAIGCC